jgi:hypothetical protein
LLELLKDGIHGAGLRYTGDHVPGSELLKLR